MVKMKIWGKVHVNFFHSIDVKSEKSTEYSSSICSKRIFYYPEKKTLLWCYSLEKALVVDAQKGYYKYQRVWHGKLPFRSPAHVECFFAPILSKNTYAVGYHTSCKETGLFIKSLNDQYQVEKIDLIKSKFGSQKMSQGNFAPLIVMMKIY